jgi:hypothetical protein
MREKGNIFHFRVSHVIPEMLRHEHISSKSNRCWQEFSSSCPEKVNAQTMAIKLGWISQLDEWFGFEEGGSRSSPFEVEGLARDVGFMLTTG